MLTIDAKGIYYKQLNRMIRSTLAKGEDKIILENVLGQRYIGGGLQSQSKFEIYGVPGQDLAAFMNGPDITVYANAQDGVANTMNAGKIVIHGKAGEIPGHSMRGGKLFIKGDVEYRAGIHMKEYQDQIPWLVIGGAAKDYCGEYMAGGRIVVLNLDEKKFPVGYCVGTGIHGGAIYVRGKVENYNLGRSAVFAEIDEEDQDFLHQALKEFSQELGMNIDGISFDDFTKVSKKGHRPFGKLYTSAMNIKNLKPKHINLTPPCKFNCPSSIPTSVYIGMIREGHIKEAQLLMDEFTPFRMSVCANVCPALCMQGCNRNLIDSSVEIQNIAKEYYPDFMPVQPKQQRDESVAIIGAGPAGLSAAWYLSRKGYQVSVYDKAKDLGGKLRNAIPEERLSDEVLNQDMNRIKSYPIQFKLNTEVTKGFFNELYDSHNAVIIACGAQVSRRIPYTGGEKILSGLEFLYNINSGSPMDLKQKEVVVIGAGNAGMDIACESWRLGAGKVTAIDIQKPLAFGKELDLASNLGTDILWPKFIERLNGKKIYFKDGSDINADVVFFSIGEVPDISFLPESVMVSDHGYLTVNEKSFRTTDAKVFGCGDIIKQGLVTDAIGSGRLAAMEVHALINKEPFIYPEKHLVPQKRINVDYFGDEKQELDKCISCGTCIYCDKCVETCPQGAVTRNGEVFTIEPTRCTTCYTCVQICPRGALHYDFFKDFAEATIEMD